MKTRSILITLLLLGAVAAAVYYWWRGRQEELPAWIASGNGRIEAVEIDVAAKTAGRIEDILVDEGEFVNAGQTLARMDTDVLEAQLREAQAQLERARIGVRTAQSQVRQRDAEIRAARAVVAQRQAELEAARKQLARTEGLVASGTEPQERLDEVRARFEGARAAVAAAEAQVAAAESAKNVAEATVVSAGSEIEAVQATIERIEADINDSILTSPRDGRVQYRVAEPGEVVSPGGAVLNLVDVGDVYMTFFLPTEQAGVVAIGTEARIVLDAAPQYVIPAEISFVADVAQFTPKTVETEEEREKLMFRLRARIDKDLLRRYLRQVKTGLPGVAYVLLDPGAEWPPDLRVNLPE